MSHSFGTGLSKCRLRYRINASSGSSDPALRRLTTCAQARPGSERPADRTESTSMNTLTLNDRHQYHRSPLKCPRRREMKKHPRGHQPHRRISRRTRATPSEHQSRSACIDTAERSSASTAKTPAGAEERTDLAHGQRNPFLRLLPREDADFSFRREHPFHRDGVRMRRDVIWQNQHGILAISLKSVRKDEIDVLAIFVKIYRPSPS